MEAPCATGLTIRRMSDGADGQRTETSAEMKNHLRPMIKP